MNRRELLMAAGGLAAGSVVFGSDEKTGALPAGSTEESAVFEPTIDATNSPVTAGNDLTVDYSVSNTGGSLNNSTDVLLKVDDIDSTQKDSDNDVTVSAGGSKTGQLVWTTDSAGDYTAAVVVGENSVTQSITVESAAPDSVLTRDADDNIDTVNGGDAYGLEFTTNVEWPEIGGEISANTDGVTRVRIKRASDGKIMGSISGQNLTGGDTYTITLDSNLVSGETYYLLHDANGSSYTLGSFSGSNYPYESADGNLSLTDNRKEGNSTSLGPSGTVRFGNVGFS